MREYAAKRECRAHSAAVAKEGGGVHLVGVRSHRGWHVGRGSHGGRGETGGPLVRGHVGCGIPVILEIAGRVKQGLQIGAGGELSARHPKPAQAGSCMTLTYTLKPQGLTPTSIARTQAP